MNRFLDFFIQKIYELNSEKKIFELTFWRLYFMKLISSWGFILLAIYLIITGIAALASFTIPPIIMAILAIVAGVLILIGK